MTKLYLVRHGTTDFNARGLLHGITDIPLNEDGEAQARTLANVLQCADFSHIYSSPLTRATQTARIIARGRPVEADIRLRERSYGIYEGTYMSPEFREKFRFGFGFPDIEGGESINEVIRRADDFIRDKILPSSGRILVVGHGFITSCIINRLLSNTPNFENLLALKPCSYAVYDVTMQQIKAVGEIYG